MKKTLRALKKGLAILLCLAATYTAVPLLNYLDTEKNHLHTICRSNENCKYHGLFGHCEDKECCTEHKSIKSFFKTLFEDFSISAEASNCPHNRLSPLYCDAAHPHYTFYDCRDCLARLYTGGTMYKSNCSTCNPALNCTHSGSKWIDPSHPHPVYCQTCSKVLSYGYSSYCTTCNPCAGGHIYGAPCYSSAHPHHGYAYCTICGTSNYVGTTTTSSCTTCDPCVNGHVFTDGPWVDANHTQGMGHAEYNYCDTGNCTVKQYTGNYAYKSNCKQCNPDLICKHTGEFWTETIHPNPIYRSCSDVIQSFSTLRHVLC